MTGPKLGRRLSNVTCFSPKLAKLKKECSSKLNRVFSQVKRKVKIYLENVCILETDAEIAANTLKYDLISGLKLDRNSHRNFTETIEKMLEKSNWNNKLQAAKLVLNFVKYDSYFHRNLKR